MFPFIALKTAIYSDGVEWERRGTNHKSDTLFGEKLENTDGHKEASKTGAV